MKYSEMIPFALEGKWVRHGEEVWQRLLENGSWTVWAVEDNKKNQGFYLDKRHMLLSTWEVKPEDQFIWIALSGKVHKKEPVFPGNCTKYKLVEVIE